MNNFDFVAWSLVASGMTAIAIVSVPRIWLMATGKPRYYPSQIQGVILSATLLLLGLMIMRIVCHRLLNVEPPRWSLLATGPMFLLVGVQNLVAPYESGPNHMPAKTMAYIMCAIGLLISVFEFSDFLFTART